MIRTTWLAATTAFALAFALPRDAHAATDPLEGRGSARSARRRNA